MTPANRPARHGEVQTVLGPIVPDDLGPTLMHAHLDMPNDAVRLRAIRDLVERGHLTQILISHDICYRSRLVRWGGHGYGHIFANVVPLMRRRGFSEAEVQAILVGVLRKADVTCVA